jgi:hypothetical protein
MVDFNGKFEDILTVNPFCGNDVEKYQERS